jgi:WD40 repeat protein
MPTADYQPPPPPVRGGAATSPPRREGTRSSADAESDDDDDDEPAPLTGLTAAAKRMLEDYPDSTHANRRPPHFVPDVRVPSTHHVHAFAAFGRHVCTGSHHVKVFDTLMSESPIFVVELRETGLEFRVKDPKVTAMCFRPSGCEADEGRFLWCGTKDGHLWELDIKTGQVTDTRAYVHASPVTGIFRHKNWLISLEETGKAHVFEVGKLHDGKHTENDRLIPQLSRTIRVTDKYNFAKLVCGRLWVSSGPANRSTTSAASKGPTIRVYEPCTDGSMPAPKTMFTSEWTGAVTSATIMPFRQDVVYLGHEGGFVSIWSAADLTCLQVLKISASDILALEGVGERLWAGNRKGQIHVYNIDEKPWQVTNVWTAHPWVIADPKSSG